MSKVGILLINLGTPKSPEVRDVRNYLREFLTDNRVIDLPFLQRTLLVNLIIAPFRSFKSSKQYKEIWSSNGSPLLYHTGNLTAKLRKLLGDGFKVEFTMRYGEPSIPSTLNRMLTFHKVEKLMVVPLYPHYASSSTGSSLEKIFMEFKKYDTIPPIICSGPFYDKEGFITAYRENVKGKYLLEDYEIFLFSYHGLPERHILKASDERAMNCTFSDCCTIANEKNYFCYRASCFQTTTLIANALGIKASHCFTSFQSRLGSYPWINPFTDKVIIEKAKSGIKKILVFSPSFVSDCLETLYEIKVDYRNLFLKYGGMKLDLVESHNESDAWAEGLKKIILNQL